MSVTKKVNCTQNEETEDNSRTMLDKMVWEETDKTKELECAHESAYLCHVNFYRRPFSKNFKEVMSGLSLGTCTSNLKSGALTVLKWSY